jgi:hypothetical protein
MSASLEWEVLEEDEQGLPLDEGDTGASLRGPRWRQWLLVFLVAVALVSALGWWQAREREEALRVELRDAVHAEERVRHGGDPAQWTDLADPGAALEWRHRYALAHSRFFGEPPGLPEVRGVQLQENGTLAIARVIWPDEGTTLEEQRAYRRVKGAWLRAALPITGEPPVEQQSENFVVSAPPSVLEDVLGEPDLLAQLEAMRAHVERSDLYPRQFNERPVEIVIRPRELALLTVDEPLSRSRRMRATSPAFSRVDFHSPLPPEAQYRLSLAEGVIYRLVPPLVPPLSFETLHADRNYFTWHLLLRQAEARQWLLEEEERRLLRNYWREQLGGAWHAPWEGPLAATPFSTSQEAEVAAQRRLATALMLDYLRLRGGLDAIAEVANQVSYSLPPVGEAFLHRLDPLLSQFGGIEQFEHQLREYASAME